MTAASCPWCSADLPTPTPEHCPSCGASLVPAASDDVPGVTQVDLGALARGDPIIAPPRRSLLGFISGEYQVEEKAAPHDSLAPPPDEVRREMLRMELEAAQAEAAAMRAEAEAEAAEAAGEAAQRTPEGDASIVDGAAGPDEGGSDEASSSDGDHAPS